MWRGHASRVPFDQMPTFIFFLHGYCGLSGHTLVSQIQKAMLASSHMFSIQNVSSKVDNLSKSIRGLSDEYADEQYLL